MVTVAQARTILLSMPNAQEKAHQGHPDFRVGGKVFATLWPGKSVAVLKLPIADQTGLVQMDPDAFSLNAWSHLGATNVHLERMNAARFRRLADLAWRNVAPRRMHAEREKQGERKRDA